MILQSVFPNGQRQDRMTKRPVLIVTLTLSLILSAPGSFPCTSAECCSAFDGIEPIECEHQACGTESETLHSQNCSTPNSAGCSDHKHIAHRHSDRIATPAAISPLVRPFTCSFNCSLLSARALPLEHGTASLRENSPNRDYVFGLSCSFTFFQTNAILRI